MNEREKQGSTSKMSESFTMNWKMQEWARVDKGQQEDRTGRIPEEEIH